MLKKQNISPVQIYSPEWHLLRLGKFTSSRMINLMADKEFGVGAMTYIDQKVGEEITGQPITDDDEVEDENTAWGNQYEPEAIRKFHEKNKVDFLVTQRLIHAPNTRFSSTPDAIWVHGLALNGDEYNVSTLEVKCPRKYHRYNKLYRCNTPKDLYNTDKKYYWQVLDQMDNCDSAIGYFGVYHPLYPADHNFKQIQFKKLELWDDFKLLKQRKASAEKKFNELKEFFKPI